MAVGTSIVLAGTIVSMLFEFLSRILNIAVIIATLGLQDGATRQIAYHRGRGNMERAYSTVVSSLELTTVTGWPYIHGWGCVLAFSGRLCRRSFRFSSGSI